MTTWIPWPRRIWMTEPMCPKGCPLDTNCDACEPSVPIPNSPPGNIMTPDMLKMILATLIKVYGESSVIKLTEVELKLPLVLKIIPFTPKEAHLVLLEGNEAIKKWEQISEKQEGAQEDEIPNSPREPGQQVE